MVHFPEKIRVNYVAFKLRYAWKIVRNENKAKRKPIMPKSLKTNKLPILSMPFTYPLTIPFIFNIRNLGRSKSFFAVLTCL